MSKNRSGIPESDFNPPLAVVLFMLLVLALGAGAIYLRFFGPCDLWRGGSIFDVPARCIPELAKP